MPATVNPTIISDLDSSEAVPAAPPPSRCGTICRFLRQVVSFLLSHIGLLSLVVGYCIMGAFVFEELERDHELMVKKSMTKNRWALHQVTDNLWEITKAMEVLRQDNWTAEVTSELRNFEKSLIVALKEKGWDGKESLDTVTWSFTGGLFYSITVITTIGYGHIAPKTPVAKIVTIFYAILGIPLTVLCWSNIGDAMANSFRFCYWRVCCYVCTKKPKKKNRRQRTVSRHSRGVSVRHARGRSVRRSQMGNAIKSPDTISDSYSVSYSISDPDKMLDLVDPTKDLIGLEGAQPVSGFQQRGKATRRSFQRSGGTTGNQLSPGPLLPNNVPLQNNEDEGVPINVELPDQQPEPLNQQPPNNNVPTTGQQQKAESKKKISTAAAKFAGLKSGLSQGLKREKSVKSTTGSNSSSTSQQQQQGVPDIPRIRIAPQPVVRTQHGPRGLRLDGRPLLL